MARNAGSKATANRRYEKGCPILFHPDYTVGSGITPDLLTSDGV